MKPLVEITDFQRLDLRIGTAVAIHPHPSVASLAAVRVQLGEPIDALAPASEATKLTPGTRVVVATGLHPLIVGDLRFTAFLLTAAGLVGAAIPDGSRLS